MKRLKKFEDVEIVKKSELGNNWSAEYKVNIAKGLKPYVKKNGIFTEVANDKTLPNNVVYLKPNQAKKYNTIGEKIKTLEEEQKSILK